MEKKYGGIKVKGTPLVADKEYIREKYGEEGIKKVASVMTPEFANIFENELFPSKRYSMEFRISIHDAINEIYAKGSMRYFWNMGRYGAEHNANKMYKSLVKWLGPIRMISIAKMFWKLIYSKSYIEVETTSKSITLELHDFPRVKPSLCNTIGGYTERLLEIAGSKNVHSKEITCVFRGDKYCKFSFTWD